MFIKRENYELAWAFQISFKSTLENCFQRRENWSLSNPWDVCCLSDSEGSLHSCPSPLSLISWWLLLTSHPVQVHQVPPGFLEGLLGTNAAQREWGLHWTTCQGLIERRLRAWSSAYSGLSLVPTPSYREVFWLLQPHQRSLEEVSVLFETQTAPNTILDPKVLSQGLVCNKRSRDIWVRTRGPFVQFNTYLLGISSKALS